MDPTTSKNEKISNVSPKNSASELAPMRRSISDQLGAHTPKKSDPSLVTVASSSKAETSLSAKPSASDLLKTSSSSQVRISESGNKGSSSSLHKTKSKKGSKKRSKKKGRKQLIEELAAPLLSITKAAAPKEERTDGTFNAPPPLTEFCLRCIVKNFKDHPLMLSNSGIPRRFVSKVIELLPTSLPASISARHLCGPESEPYWKNCCKTKWQNCDVRLHGSEWKRAYFESMLQVLLEEYNPINDNTEILQFMDTARDYIFNLTLQQLLSHFDLRFIFSRLINLTGVSLTYGARNLGTDFEFDKFGMKIKDCEDLGNILCATHSLSSLSLPNNLIDDSMLKVLVRGLRQNNTITHLDLSHNRIGDRGIKSLSKLVRSKECTISTLNLTNNQIYATGGGFLGKAMHTNMSLESLILRLNRLEDEGGILLLDGLKYNNTITSLNISSNNLGPESARLLSELLWTKKPSLKKIDVSNNPFGKKGAEQFEEEGLERNEYVTEFDARSCELGKQTEELIQNWVKGNAQRTNVQ